MVSNGTVARGQVQKSNGIVETRLVWQGKRDALKSSGKVQSSYDLRLNGVKRQSNRLEENINARARTGKEPCWPCVGLLSEGKDQRCKDTEVNSKEQLRKCPAWNGEGYEWP